MLRTKLLASIRRSLAVLAVLLLLCGLAFTGTASAQDESLNVSCVQGLELPAELAQLDLAGLQVALQALVDADPEAMVTVQRGGPVRADLLLADEAVLVALIEGQPVNLTLEFPQGGEGALVIVAIEMSTAGDCTIPDVCVSGIVLPAALTDLEVAGLRAALEELIATDVDAMVTVRLMGEGETVVRADVLQGLADPELEAVLAGEPLTVSARVQGGEPIEIIEIVGIALPGPECGGPGGGPPEPEPKPGTMPDNQQDGGKDTTPDNQQTDGDKDTGAGAGKSQYNQQGGGGDTVTKTFELTLDGTVPVDQAFGVVYSSSEDPEELIPLALCGQPGGRLADKEDCEGGGSVYTANVNVEAGTTLKFVFFRVTEGNPDSYEAFHLGTETINADMTNTAWYTFGKGTGAGDEQQMPDNQQDGDGKDTGADDEQQDDTLDQDTGAGDDSQDDVQDNQQAQVPEEMPETGAGALAPGATIPVGNVAAGLTMLLGAVYAVLRRR